MTVRSLTRLPVLLTVVLAVAMSGCQPSSLMIRPGTTTPGRTQNPVPGLPGMPGAQPEQPADPGAPASPATPTTQPTPEPAIRLTVNVPGFSGPISTSFGAE